MNEEQNALFASGLDVTQWKPLDWGVAIAAGYALWVAFAALRLSARRLK